MKRYKVISLFSGAGGMDLGFIRAGFDIVWANDFFKEAVETYKFNIGNHIVFGDISKIDSIDIPSDIDVVIGGFPCQGFSVANKNRNENDQRNFLYKEMLRIIKDKKPKVFVAENVKGILSLARGKVFDLIKSDFEEIGYHVEAKLLNAAEYGVPQARERVIIIGSLISTTIDFPQKTHYLDEKSNSDFLKKALTTEEAIGWLSSISTADYPIHYQDDIIFNHNASDNVKDKFWGRKYDVNQHEVCDYLKTWRAKSGWTTKKIDEHFGYKHTAGHWFRKDNNSGSIPKPSDWWELKKILGFDDKYDELVTAYIEKEIKFEQSLRITNWDRPSDTITATSPEIHVNKWRRLSARECAILQTFPNDFVFKGTLSKVYTQIGNAVPVLLAEKIAYCVKKELDKI
jgi:DNA (cytosine-5)-methyltransferase 1